MNDDSFINLIEYYIYVIVDHKHKFLERRETDEKK